jgi:hypothetical protein
VRKFFKERIYKLYRDEVWGNLVFRKKFSYNKRNVLKRFRDIILRRRLNLTYKYKYFKRGFLKTLFKTQRMFKLNRAKFRRTRFVELNRLRAQSQALHLPTRKNALKPELLLTTKEVLKW